MSAAVLGLLAGPAKSVNDAEELSVANLNILHGFACDPAAADTGDQK